MSIRTYLLLGSNLGDRKLMLQAARTRIEVLAGPVVASSALYETAAWGKTDQPSFLNQALAIDTTLEPTLLLTTLLAIERSMGRIRAEKWDARPIDIDILFYDDQVIQRADLVIPHPAMAERRFVLEPLNEIASEFKHPESGLTVNQLLEQCADPLEVRKAG
jgi:2-amino-4-hydroxy-6-hydroxymethyldihydropteridine diphosphokinase